MFGVVLLFENIVCFLLLFWYSSAAQATQKMKDDIHGVGYILLLILQILRGFNCWWNYRVSLPVSNSTKKKRRSSSLTALAAWLKAFKYIYIPHCNANAMSKSQDESIALFEFLFLKVFCLSQTFSFKSILNIRS